jgi:hypothetical protein
LTITLTLSGEELRSGGSQADSSDGRRTFGFPTPNWAASAWVVLRSVGPAMERSAAPAAQACDLLGVFGLWQFGNLAIWQFRQRLDVHAFGRRVTMSHLSMEVQLYALT